MAEVYPAPQGIEIVAAYPRDYRAIVLIALAIALAVNGAVVGWAFWYAARLPTVELTNLWMEEDRLICPGDALDYKFTLTVSKQASVDLYTSDERVLPQERIAYTRLQQFTFDAPTELEITRHFVLPSTYIDAHTMEEVVWTPGDYMQRTTANVVGRSDQAEIAVPFTVDMDCALRFH